MENGFAKSGWNLAPVCSSDCRYGLRQLRKNSGATTVMVLPALAIGATTAIFSVVYGVLLARCRTAMRTGSWPCTSQLAGRRSRLAEPQLHDFRGQNRSFQAIANQRVRSIRFRGCAPTRTT